MSLEDPFRKRVDCDGGNCVSVSQRRFSTNEVWNKYVFNSTTLLWFTPYLHHTQYSVFSVFSSEFLIFWVLSLLDFNVSQYIGIWKNGFNPWWTSCPSLYNISVPGQSFFTPARYWPFVCLFFFYTNSISQQYRTEPHSVKSKSQGCKHFTLNNEHVVYSSHYKFILSTMFKHNRKLFNKTLKVKVLIRLIWCIQKKRVYF